MKKTIICFLMMTALLSGCNLVAEKTSVTPDPAQNTPYVFSAENFPTLAGGTSLEPMGEAVSAILLGEDAPDLGRYLSFGESGDAWSALLDGGVGLVLAPRSSGELWSRVTAGCDTAIIAEDGLVFYVSESNPVESLTIAQLREIFSGEVTNWSEVGGLDEPIKAFPRDGQSGSRAALEELVMAGMSVAAVSDEPSETVFDGSGGAIGFTFGFSALELGLPEGSKLIAVEGTAPTAESIAAGDYPLVTDYYAAISKDAGEESPERILLEWLGDKDAQNFIATLGYVTAVR